MVETMGYNSYASSPQATLTFITDGFNRGNNNQ